MRSEALLLRHRYWTRVRRLSSAQSLSLTNEPARHGGKAGAGAVRAGACLAMHGPPRAGALEDGGAGALPAVGSASSLGAGGGEVRRRDFRRLVSNASVSEDTSFFESVSRTTARTNNKGAASAAQPTLPTCPCTRQLPDARMAWWLPHLHLLPCATDSPACRPCRGSVPRGTRVPQAWTPFRSSQQPSCHA